MPEFCQPGGPLRQSLLRSAERCMLSAKWQAQGSWPNPLSDLGTVMHAIYAAALRHIQATGEQQVAIDDMKRIAAEVYAASPIMLPTEQRRDMRWLLWRFCDHKWDASRILFVEERITVDVPCPDGKVRQLTGQPDIVIAQPPKTLILVDHKNGRARPPAPRDPSSHDAWLRDNGRAYLSADGTYQLDAYGYLLLRRIPAAQRVILREFHWRFKELREATLERDELPQVEQELGTHLMKLARALSEGDESPLWRPRPGSHCRYCPRPFECPIPVEERVGGMILTPEDVAAWSDVWVASKALHGRVDKELKAAHADGLPPARVGDQVLGWDREGSGRRFTLFDAVDPPERQAEQAIADDVFAKLR